MNSHVTKPWKQLKIWIFKRSSLKFLMKSTKVVFIGDCGVGKTCIIDKIEHDEFDENTPSSISIAMHRLTGEYNHTTLDFSLWDTAGQEKYRTLAPIYFREASIGVLVYDITSTSTFDSLDSWYSEVDKQMVTGYKLIIVANKRDLEDRREVSFNQGISYAEKAKTDLFFEVSAKDGEGINELYNCLLHCVYEVQTQPMSVGVKIDQSKVKKPKDCCK